MVPNYEHVGMSRPFDIILEDKFFPIWTLADRILLQADISYMTTRPIKILRKKKSPGFAVAIGGSTPLMMLLNEFYLMTRKPLLLLIRLLLRAEAEHHAGCMFLLMVSRLDQ